MSSGLLGKSTFPSLRKLWDLNFLSNLYPESTLIVYFLAHFLLLPITAIWPVENSVGTAKRDQLLFPYMISLSTKVFLIETIIVQARTVFICTFPRMRFRCSSGVKVSVKGWILLALRPMVLKIFIFIYPSLCWKNYGRHCCPCKRLIKSEREVAICRRSATGRLCATKSSSQFSRTCSFKIKKMQSIIERSFRQLHPSVKIVFHSVQNGVEIFV